MANEQIALGMACESGKEIRFHVTGKEGVLREAGRISIAPLTPTLPETWLEHRWTLEDIEGYNEYLERGGANAGDAFNLDFKQTA